MGCGRRRSCPLFRASLAIAWALTGCSDSSTTTTRSPGATTADATPRECTGAEFGARWGTSGVAAGTAGVEIIVTNASDHACRLSGRPQLEVLAPSPGAVVVTTPPFDPDEQPAVLLLEPGQAAQATLFGSNQQNYPDGRCPDNQLPDGVHDARLIIGGATTGALGPVPLLPDYRCDPRLTGFTARGA